MAVPRDEPAAIEDRIFEDTGVSVNDLPRTGPLKCVGGRRPLRFRPEDVSVNTGVDDLERYLELRFTLPPGCYATSLLREISKDYLTDRQPIPDHTES